MSPQNDSFSDYVEIVQWINKRSGYSAFEDLASLSAAVPPFEFDDEDNEDLDWDLSEGL